MNSFVKIALNYFLKKDYVYAINMYSNAIKDDPDNEEAKVGIMLCDMALGDDEENAHNLLDYYFIVKSSDSENAYKIINQLIDSDSKHTKNINDAILSTIKDKFESLDGILFNDFLNIFKASDMSKIVFENILFSSKIVISDKNELIAFISLAINHGFKNITDNYLDSLIITFEYNKGVIEFIEELRNEQLK